MQDETAWMDSLAEEEVEEKKQWLTSPGARG